MGHFSPNCPNAQNTQKTGITQFLDDLGRRVRPHLLRNVKLKIIDYFRCVPPHDLGYLGPVPQIFLMLKYPKVGIIWFTDSFYTRLKSDWMWNVVLTSVYSCFYAVIKIILFSFKICMNVDNWARLLSCAISNFVVKDIFVEQPFILINPV